MPSERPSVLLSYAFICVVMGMAAFAYVVYKSIAYVLHPQAFGGFQLSDALLTRTDLGGGVLFGWFCVLVGIAFALWILPPRAEQVGLLVIAALLAIGGAGGLLYSLHALAGIPNLAQQWEGLGALAIYPWIAVAFFSLFTLLASVFMLGRGLRRRRVPLGRAISPA
jgi:hypothetical protein